MEAQWFEQRVLVALYEQVRSTVECERLAVVIDDADRDVQCTQHVVAVPYTAVV